MKILLLGGNGYIGSKFYSITKNVTSIDLLLFNKDLGYSQFENFNELTSDYIKDFDVVICLAGHSSVQMCEYSPERSWINNVEYFRNLCEKLGDQKLIYASSASVYGTQDGISTELSPINFNPLCHYDLQKTTIDLIANKYIRQGKNIVGFRFGTVNGSSPNIRKELMINSMVKNSIEKGHVFAKNMHIRRAILGINDLVRALTFTTKNDILPGQYNLSSFNSTVGEMAKTVSDICNVQLLVGENDPLAYDFELSTEKFQKETGFEFKDTVQSLVYELFDFDEEMNSSTRTENDGNFERYL